MKKIMSILILGLVVTAASAQDRYLDEFFSRHEKNGQGINVNMDNPGPWLSGMLSDKEAGSLASKITGFHLMILKEADDPNLDADLAELSRNLEGDHFDQLVTVRKTGDLVNILARSNKGNIRDMVLLLKGSDQVIVANVEGNLNEKDMEHIESSMNKSKDSSR
jgi:hypothetical protein